MRTRTILILTSLLAVAACGGDDDPMEPQVDPGQILILHDDSTHVEVTAILTAEGFDVTDGGRYDAYDGADLGAYDLVIFLDGWEYGLGMSDAGQQGLLDYVSAGGVLLVTEWVGYDYDPVGGEYTVLTPALPLEYQGSYCDNGAGACTETYTLAAIHAIVNGLPVSFTTPTDWTYSIMDMNFATTSSNARALITGSGSGTALAIADRGSGHIVQWSMGGVYGGPDIWDANTEAILINLAEFAN